MTQQVAVGTCLAPQGVGLARVFSQRQGDSTITPPLPDFTYQLGNPLRLFLAPFAALQHKGAETEVISLLAASQYLLMRERVTGHMAVAAADTAVQAVVAACVGEFNKPSHVNPFTELLL